MEIVLCKTNNSSKTGIKYSFSYGVFGRVVVNTGIMFVIKIFAQTKRTSPGNVVLGTKSHTTFLAGASRTNMADM